MATNVLAKALNVEPITLSSMEARSSAKTWLHKHKDSINTKMIRFITIKSFFLPRLCFI